MTTAARLARNGLDEKQLKVFWYTLSRKQDTSCKHEHGLIDRYVKQSDLEEFPQRPVRCTICAVRPRDTGDVSNALQ